METKGRNGIGKGADERPDIKKIALEAAQWEVTFGSFGEYIDWFMKKLGLSENRLADLADVHVSVISRIIGHNKPASEGVMLRILVAMLGLSTAHLDFINRGLAADGRDPHELGVPGRRIPSHEEYARRKRGSVLGKRFGNGTTEAARARQTA